MGFPDCSQLQAFTVSKIEIHSYVSQTELLHILLVSFSPGDTSVYLHEVIVNDAKWHAFRWNRYRNNFQLYMDDKFIRGFSVAGPDTSLDLRNNGTANIYISKLSGNVCHFI